MISTKMLIASFLTNYFFKLLIVFVVLTQFVSNINQSLKLAMALKHSQNLMFQNTFE